MSRSPTWAFFGAAAVLVAAFNFLRQLPTVHSLEAYVFGDPGWALTVDAMLADGLIPTVDFAYFYGLLGLLVDRAWFDSFGRTAVADTALIAVCNLLIVLGIVRFARALVLPRISRWVLLAGIPIAVMPLPYPSPTHALEAALLVNALACHARGRLALALVLAIVTVFVKPALGYPYSAGLVGLILLARRAEPTPWRTRLLDLLPAAATALVLGVLLAARFGAGPLVATLVPGAAAKTYADEGFGFFFGTGQRFWLKANAAYYLFGPAGFWLASSALLLLAPIFGLLRRAGPPDCAASAILACLVLHGAFVGFLFGHELSWLYYSYLPVLGACGVIGRWEAAGRGPKWLPAALLALALCNWVLPMGYGAMIWRGNSRSETTAGLFASPTERAWDTVRELAKAKKVLILTPSGAGHAIFPELDSTRTWVLLKPVAMRVEVERVAAQIRAADVVVLHRDTAAIFETWPEFNRELAAFAGDEVEPDAASFRIYRRVKA